MRILQRRLVRVAATAVAVVGWGALVLTPTGASAAVVDNREPGLASPDTLIDFGIALFANGTIITNQFEFSDGVTFGSNYQYLGSSSSLVGFLKNPDPPPPFFGSPGNISFTSDVTAAVFSFLTNADELTVTAALDGTTVALLITRNLDTFHTSTLPPFYGFEGVLFDELRFLLRGTLAPGGFTYSLDNLQYNVAVTPVPLPAALPLFLSALAGLGLMGWRRRADA